MEAANACGGGAGEGATLGDAGVDDADVAELLVTVGLEGAGDGRAAVEETTGAEGCAEEEDETDGGEVDERGADEAGTEATVIWSLAGIGLGAGRGAGWGGAGAGWGCCGVAGCGLTVLAVRVGAGCGVDRGGPWTMQGRTVVRRSS